MNNLNTKNNAILHKRECFGRETLSRVKLAYQTWWVSLAGWRKFQMSSSVTNEVNIDICILGIEVDFPCDGGFCEEIYKKNFVYIFPCDKNSSA